MGFSLVIATELGMNRRNHKSLDRAVTFCGHRPIFDRRLESGKTRGNHSTIS